MTSDDSEGTDLRDSPACDTAGGRPEGAGSPGSATRQRILLTALECFADHGYAGTSIRDMAQRMGVTKAALYYHFASKEDLLDALIEPIVSEIRDLAERAGAGAGAEEVLGSLVDILSRRSALIRTVMADPSVPHRGQRPPAIDHLRTVVAALAAGGGEAALLRARAAVGAAQFATFSTAMQRTGDGPPPPLAVLSGTEHLLDAEERAEVLAAALRALG